ncbi:hypothetical protein G6F37_010102 [Rhizopus arrhizus]|nr:hypothetical protein G6F38_005249 [Rhizopus arrhizus]KAG1153723.1 hypothetical protein G6F37_010102 [Rhizopus arrhizus]
MVNLNTFFKTYNLLQRKRGQLLCWNTSLDIFSALHHIKSQIDQLSENSADILALRSGVRWRERGEGLNVYFFCTIKLQQQKQANNMLQNQNGATVTTLPHPTECARQFYEKLYTPDPIDPDAVTTLLNSLPEPTDYHLETNAGVLTHRSADDISRCLQPAPRNSSPGGDGLPTKLFRYCFSTVSADGFFK